MTKPLTVEQVQELKKWLQSQEEYWSQQRAYWHDYRGDISVGDQCALAQDVFVQVLQKLASLEEDDKA